MKVLLADTANPFDGARRGGRGAGDVKPKKVTLGALVGGLILGVLEGIVPAFLPSSWVPVIEFVLFIVILIVRPSGLFGGKN